MKTIANIDRIRPEQVGDEAFRDLCLIHPGGNQQRWFECSLSQDDPRYREIVDRLAVAGLRPWTNLFEGRPSDEYALQLRREYEAEDFRDVSYFEPEPEVFCEGLTRDADGRIEMNVDRLETDANIAMTSGVWLVVSSRLKSSIEQEGLRHVVFRPTALRDDVEGPISWEGHGEPFWEITSDFLLPNLSPSCTLYHDDGQPFTGDYSKGCIFKEGLYTHAEARYRASDLSGIGEFDLALTNERFGSGWPRDDTRRLVASRRFYDFCTLRGLSVEWFPVRVEAH